jgi:hypothetical protein
MGNRQGQRRKITAVMDRLKAGNGAKEKSIWSFKGTGFMKTEFWIFCQMIIDMIMFGLLIWLVLLMYRRQKSGQEFDGPFQRSEIIISEMKEVSRALEKNLEQKKELSRNILKQLDEGLKRAEGWSQKMTLMDREFGQRIGRSPSLESAEERRTAINDLLKRGLSQEKVAKYLGMSVGEIELILKLPGP